MVQVKKKRFPCNAIFDPDGSQPKARMVNTLIDGRDLERSTQQYCNLV